MCICIVSSVLHERTSSEIIKFFHCQRILRQVQQQKVTRRMGETLGLQVGGDLNWVGTWIEKMGCTVTRGGFSGVGHTTLSWLHTITYWQAHLLACIRWTKWKDGEYEYLPLPLSLAWVMGFWADVHKLLCHAYSHLGNTLHPPVLCALFTPCTLTYELIIDTWIFISIQTSWNLHMDYEARFIVSPTHTRLDLYIYMTRPPAWLRALEKAVRSYSKSVKSFTLFWREI